MSGAKHRADGIGRIGGGVEAPLKGWREIAEFLGRDQSTVRRWAESRRLPVFRASEGGRGVPVHAYGSELQAWLRDEARRGGMDGHLPATDKAREAGEETAPAVELPRNETVTPRRLALVVGVCLGVGFCLGTIASLGGVLLASYGRPAARLAVAGAAVPEAARELYLRGSFLWHRRTAGSIAEAIGVLDRAVTIHPDYAEAHAALATSYILAERYQVRSGWEAFPKAERAARRAIALNPDLDLAQSALAYLEFRWHWDADAGFARFERTLSRHPKSADTLFWYANVLMLAGRAEEALPLVIEAEEIDPDSSAIRTLHAHILFLLGRTEESRGLLEEIVARDPGYPWPRYTLCFIRLAAEDYSAYLDTYIAFGDALGVARYREAADAGRTALAGGGARAMAEAMAAVETLYYERGEALAWDVARHFAIAGRADEALSWLRIAANRREARLMDIQADPAFRPMRDDARFRDFLANLGFPES
ncbi:tetratricopeptide repeat protein [Shinella sp. BYT-45]|uniref:tetratricopeptide repeat protein n=1 Tax=Shinella sp. BYT-45 TaxID=3377377 RepID=UPI003980C365